MMTTPRCPYCHDDCPPRVDAVICGDCRAPHHSECWDHDGRCASCRSQRALRAEAGEGAIRLIAGLGLIPMSAIAICLAGIGIAILTGVRCDLEEAVFTLNGLIAPAIIFAAFSAILARLAFAGSRAGVRFALGPVLRGLQLIFGLGAAFGAAWTMREELLAGVIWIPMGLVAIAPSLIRRRLRRRDPAPGAAAEVEAPPAKERARSKLRVHG